MAAQSRIYKVTNDNGAIRLIRACHPSQAITHVARSAYVAAVATQDDLVTALQAGAKIESVRDEQLPLID